MSARCFVFWSWVLVFGSSQLTKTQDQSPNTKPQSTRNQHQACIIALFAAPAVFTY